MPACQKRAPDLNVDGCEPPCGCWELNSEPLEVQPVLLTSEPSLHGTYKVDELRSEDFNIYRLKTVETISASEHGGQGALARTGTEFTGSNYPRNPSLRKKSVSPCMPGRLQPGMYTPDLIFTLLLSRLLHTWLSSLTWTGKAKGPSRGRI